MRDIYYNEINYFEPIAGMKQTAIQEAAEDEEGKVSLNDFQISKAMESKSYKVGKDIEEHMMGEVMNMQDGELRYAKLEEVAKAMVSPRKVAVTIDKVSKCCVGIIDSNESVVVDDEGTVVNVDPAELFNKMAEENFTKCYFVKDAGNITKYEPSVVKEADEYSKTMTVNKYAVYGRI